MADAAKVAETRFGYFDPTDREYVITSPGTPSPWINYMGLEGQLCAMISSTCGGPTWFRDPLQLRLTRYISVGSNKDRPGRWLYLRDNDSGEFWSPSYQPVTHVKPDEYECRHGLGYTKIVSSTNGIAAEMLHFIPLGAHLEVQRIVLRNDTDRVRNLSAFTYREFVNCTAANDLENIQYSGHLAQMKINESDSRYLHVLTLHNTGKPTPVFAVSEKPAGYDTKCEVFIGDGSIEDPEVVRTGETTNSDAGDDTIVGVFRMDVTLQPGEEKVLRCYLGIADEPQLAAALVSPWLEDDAKVMRAFEDLKAYAGRLLETYQCWVPDEEMAVTVNTWNAYQCWINFQFSRSISGYAAGVGRSMGTRDSLQDLLGYMHMSPDGARQRIIELLKAVQLQNGNTQHQYSALHKQGMGEAGYSDDQLWSVLAVDAYVKETGDVAILDEEFAYTDNAGLVEDLYHHLLRAVKYSFDDRGRHGIPRLRRADWNDCLGGNPNDEVSESVLVGIMLSGMARMLAELTKRSGREDVEVEHEGSEMPVLDYLQMVADESARAVNEEAWQEEGWYARGTDPQGEWFGVPSREQGRIFLEPQPWSVMTGVASEERGREAMDSVYEHLYTPYGIMVLFPGCNPAPSGGFHIYPVGSKENAGIFCHPNPWAVVAETMLGRGDRAFEFYCATLPAKASQEDPVHYCAEPYVHGQLRYGREHIEHGKTAGTWLTGTAAWNYVAATQYILGVRPDWDGLRVDPCVPASWEEFGVTRTFRGATYEIHVKNPDGVCRGVKSMTLDGEPVDGNLLPVLGDGKPHRVEVVMG